MILKLLVSTLTMFSLQSSTTHAVDGDVSLSVECENIPPDQQAVVPVNQRLLANGPPAMCLDKTTTLSGLSIQKASVTHEGLKTGAWVVVTFAAPNEHALQLFQKAHLFHTVALIVRGKVVFRGLLTESRTDASLRIAAETDEEAAAIRDSL